jgi:hypothetical protein
MIYTGGALLAVGANIQPLMQTFNDAFTDAEHARPSTVQRFWNEFVTAHRTINPRQDGAKEAA